MKDKVKCGRSASTSSRLFLAGSKAMTSGRILVRRKWSGQEVPSAASGAMFAAGCFAYATGTPVAVPGAIMSQPTDMLTVEIQRPDRTGTSLVVGHSYFGTALAEDARGVSIVTDA